MICKNCDGDGMILVGDAERRGWAEPCPECDGAGIAYCCEGMAIEDGEDCED